MERRQHTDHGEEPGDVIDRRVTQEDRSLPVPGLLDHQPHAGRHQRVETRTIVQLAVVAVGTDVAVHEMREALTHLRFRHPPDGRPGTGVEQHVGAIQQGIHGRRVGLVRRVERQAPLAPLDHAAQHGGRRRRDVRALELDDPGAVVGQHHAGDGTRHAPRRVDHEETFEWSSHRSTHRPSPQQRASTIAVAELRHVTPRTRLSRERLTWRCDARYTVPPISSTKFSK